MSILPTGDQVAEFVESELNRTATETCDHPGCTSTWGPRDVARVLSASRYLENQEPTYAEPGQQ